MTTLATKLPYDHPFAGGYPRIGGQPLPTDPDAIDYLERLAAADGAAVEQGVAMAVDQFVKGCKADSADYAGDPTRTVWDALQACCIMAGARTLTGALVPLKTPYGAELVDINALPTPTIVDYGGSTSNWDAATRTMTNATFGSDPGYPRFRFSVGCVAGKQYAVQGLLSGDTGDINQIRLSTGGGDSISYDAATGVISGVVVALAGTIEFLLNGTKGPSSIRIESLSIREDPFTPTPYNFASADYDRSTGLKGDGSTTYLDSGRAVNDDGQDDNHLAVYAQSLGTTQMALIGASERSPYSYRLLWHLVGGYIDAWANTLNTDSLQSGLVSGSTFAATSRSSSSSQSSRVNGIDYSDSLASVTPSARGVYVFARDDSDGTPDHSDARLAFYSIGSSLDLAALDARVTTLISSITAALS